MTARDALAAETAPVNSARIPAEGMVEKRGIGLWFTHAGLILGVIVIFFPIWLAFVASTVSQPEIVRPPMPLLPGDVISTGTPGGVGLSFDPPIYLQPGDVVELGIDGLGTSRQSVAAPA